MGSIGTRVDMSATGLDEHEPGWASRIIPRRLNIESGEDCVVGQLYGEYCDGEDRLVAKGFPRHKLDGFHVDGTGPLAFIENLLLNHAWRRRIRDRVKHPERFAAATA